MSTDIVAPMSGSIYEISVSVGDEVAEDDEIIILEALKMENPIYAPAAGKVAEIKVNEGDEVETNAVLVVLE